MSDRPTRNPELWLRAAPILPTHDTTLTGGFLVALGFTLASFDPGALVATYGGAELHYVRVPGVDPFATAGEAFIRVTNADLLHAEIYAADVMPDLGAGDGAGDLEELHARWDTDRDVSRLGALEAVDGGASGFDLYDPTNNVLHCAHSV